MTTPTTPEGKALLHEWDIGDPSYAEMEAGIAKVEQSAATAERARIREAVEGLPWFHPYLDGCEETTMPPEPWDHINRAATLDAINAARPK